MGGPKYAGTAAGGEPSAMPPGYLAPSETTTLAGTGTPRVQAVWDQLAADVQGRAPALVEPDVEVSAGAPAAPETGGEGPYLGAVGRGEPHIQTVWDQLRAEAQGTTGPSTEFVVREGPPSLEAGNVTAGGEPVSANSYYGFSRSPAGPDPFAVPSDFPGADFGSAAGGVRSAVQRALGGGPETYADVFEESGLPGKPLTGGEGPGYSPEFEEAQAVLKAKAAGGLDAGSAKLDLGLARPEPEAGQAALAQAPSEGGPGAEGGVQTELRFRAPGQKGGYLGFTSDPRFVNEEVEVNAPGPEGTARGFQGGGFGDTGFMARYRQGVIDQLARDAGSPDLDEWRAALAQRYAKAGFGEGQPPPAAEVEPPKPGPEPSGAPPGGGGGEAVAAQENAGSAGQATALLEPGQDTRLAAEARIAASRRYRVPQEEATYYRYPPGTELAAPSAQEGAAGDYIRSLREVPAVPGAGLGDLSGTYDLSALGLGALSSLKSASALGQRNLQAEVTVQDLGLRQDLGTTQEQVTAQLQAQVQAQALDVPTPTILELGESGALFFPGLGSQAEPRRRPRGREAYGYLEVRRQVRIELGGPSTLRRFILKGWRDPLEAWG